MEEQTPQQQENNFWASYSDIFTTLAIIFLTLFLFALIKAGLSTIETAMVKKNHENELKGKISQEQVKKNRLERTQVEQSIEEMSKYEDLIDKKFVELNSFIKRMHQNKKMMKDIIEEGQRKDALTKTLEQTIEQNETRLKDKEFELKNMQDNLAMKDKHITEIILEKKEQEELIYNLKTKKETLIKEYINFVKESNTRLKEEDRKNDLITIVAKRKIGEIEVLKKNLEKMNQKVTKLSQEKSQLDQEVHRLSDSINQNEESFNDLKNENSTLKKKLELGQQHGQKLDQQMAQLNKNFEEKMNQALLEKQQEIDNLKNSLSETKISNEKNDKIQNSELEKKIQTIENLKTQIAQLQNEISDQQKIKNENEELKNKITTMGEGITDIKDGMRSMVAKKLAEKFKASKLNVEVDPRTGNVTLLMGENFLFARGSARLSLEAKDTLKKIIPIYSSVLFGETKLKENLASVNIEGHASPSFKKRYVAPESEDITAYDYNLNLSARRAQAITSYIFSKEFGKFRHKTAMRLLLQTIGHGPVRPIIKTQEDQNVRRDIASIESENDCGPYDCQKSQRVEFSFTLKDDKDSIQKLLKLNQQKNKAGVTQ